MEIPCTDRSILFSKPVSTELLPISMNVVIPLEIRYWMDSVHRTLEFSCARRSDCISSTLRRGLAFTLPMTGTCGVLISDEPTAAVN